MEKEIILIDIDGTIADFVGRFDEIFKARYPNEIFIPQEHRISFHIEDAFPEHLKEAISDIFHEPGFFRSLKPMDQAIEVLQDLDNKGYTIRLCSSPLTNAPGCMTEKFEWVKEHLGIHWVKKLIMADDKTVIKGKVLIDDKPKITGCTTPEWKQVYFDQPYNRLCGGKRIIHWKFCEGFLINYMGINPPK